LTGLLVVDCSVAVKWAIDEPLHDTARRVLGESSRLIAPELLLAEVANVAWRKQARKQITRIQGAELVRLVGAAIGTWYDMRSIALRAFHLAHTLDHAAYDCCYLALAELTGGRMLTDHRAFASRASKRGFGAHILRLADLPPASER
jgi:predicted nucleic acid-binding protein